MNIYIYEPDGIESSTGINISHRVAHLKKVLADYDIIELEKIQILRDNNELDKLDNSNNIIIAHYTDVEKFRFHELKSFRHALTIFHTYDNGWNPDKISSNSICKTINSTKNRFCIGSNELKENIELFVSHFAKTGNIAFEIFEGFNPNTD